MDALLTTGMASLFTAFHLFFLLRSKKTNPAKKRARNRQRINNSHHIRRPARSGVLPLDSGVGVGVGVGVLWGLDGALMGSSVPKWLEAESQ